MSRAAAAESATTAQPAKTADSVKDRLQTIRGDIFSALEQYATDGEPFVAVDPATRLAWWGNGGWRNGGWRNGGWGNCGRGNRGGGKRAQRVAKSRAGLGRPRLVLQGRHKGATTPATLFSL